MKKTCRELFEELVLLKPPSEIIKYSDDRKAYYIELKGDDYLDLLSGGWIDGNYYNATYIKAWFEELETLNTKYHIFRQGFELAMMNCC